MKRAALVGLLLFAACARAHPAQVSAVGMLSGHAVLGPTCPVQRAGQSCSKPYRGSFVAAGAQGRYPFSSDASGAFSVTLPAGEYDVRLARRSSPFPILRSARVRVTAGQTTTITLDLDTGIR